ncbi:MAG: hypothetical protein IH985_07345 [Planctomycetes bacterium]|nr:hypothetical protein [Planctomycetota bacterium]
MSRVPELETDRPTLRNHCKKDGRYRDCDLYAILRSDVDATTGRAQRRPAGAWNRPDAVHL